MPASPHPLKPTTGADLPLVADRAGSQALPFVGVSLMNRVGRILQNLAAVRQVSDDEIKQHIRDCRFLMESAYDRFQAAGNPVDREEAHLWMHRRDEAVRSLSPAFKAAREAQIQLQIAEGAGYFIDQGDAARARLVGGRPE